MLPSYFEVNVVILCVVLVNSDIKILYLVITQLITRIDNTALKKEQIMSFVLKNEFLVCFF